MYKFVIFVIFLILLVRVNGKQLVIHKFDICEEGKPYPLNITYKFIHKPGEAPVVVGDIYLDEPFGKNFDGYMDAYTFLFKQWKKVFVLSENDPCNLLKKYLGQPFSQAQQQMGLTPGVCPIPKGKYHVDRLTFDINKMSMQLPAGKVKGVIKALKDKRDVYCIDYEVEIK